MVFAVLSKGGGGFAYVSSTSQIFFFTNGGCPYTVVAVVLHVYMTFTRMNFCRYVFVTCEAV